MRATKTLPERILDKAAADRVRQAVFGLFLQGDGDRERGDAWGADHDGPGFGISPKGAIMRQCKVCDRWIGTRGYTQKIYRHLGADGRPCNGILGKPGDRRAF